MPIALKDSRIELKHESAVKYPGILSVQDGSGAVVWVESHISQAGCAYPITPSTPMGDGIAAEFSNGRDSLWGERVLFVEPESEHSSASAREGFALAGGWVTNFTSGHIGARAITSQLLNIHCGRDDVMGVADCGWGAADEFLLSAQGDRLENWRKLQELTGTEEMI